MIRTCLFAAARVKLFGYRSPHESRNYSDIEVKSYCRLNLLRASVFNYARHDILQNTIGYASNNLLSLEFSESFNFQLRVSRYISGFMRTSE